MKILYLQPAEAFGGAERQGVIHIQHLPRHGIEVVPVVGPGRPILRALDDAGVRSYRYSSYFPAATHTQLSVAGHLRYLHGWLRAIARSVRALTEIAEAEAPDLIFANRTVGWLVAAQVADRLGIPWLARAGSRPVTRLAPLGLMAMQAGWPPPAALLANCDAVLRDLGPWFRCPAFELRNAVDAERFQPAGARSAVAVPAGARVVGIAARPAPEKGLDLLLDVVAAVIREVPGTRFLWAGAYGWRAAFEARTRRAGLAHALRFLGHVDDMAGFYAACDVVILTSRRRSIEGSPNALLEAMAMERPVVATAVGGIPEIVRPGSEGFLVADGDLGAFSGAVIALLREPALRARLGAAGRRRVLEHHSVSRVASRLARLLRRIAGGPPETAPAYRGAA